MWIWQRDDWPNFSYDKNGLMQSLIKFDFNNQLSLRDSVLFENIQTDEFVVSIQGLEAMKTSEIEGEMHDLPSLVNSFRVNASIMAGEDVTMQQQTVRGKSVSSMMVDLYRKFDMPISSEMLFRWNKMLTYGENYAGRYRDYAQDMTIISSVFTAKHKDGEVEYVAPPSSTVEKEMDGFIDWYNRTGPKGTEEMHPLIRAGLAHLYFVAIHPFDDGNGRMARALSVKVISEANAEPTLIALSTAISEDKSAYYEALKEATTNHNVTAWLEYFCKTAVKAQEITKAKLYQAAVVKTYEQSHDLNDFQKKAINHAIQGRCKKGKPIITISEYIEINKPDIKDRAKKENKSLTDIAKDDLSSLNDKGIFTLSKEVAKPTYILVFPLTPGISSFYDKLGKSPHASDCRPSPLGLKRVGVASP